MCILCGENIVSRWSDRSAGRLVRPEAADPWRPNRSKAARAQRPRHRLDGPLRVQHVLEHVPEQNDVKAAGRRARAVALIISSNSKALEKEKGKQAASQCIKKHHSALIRKNQRKLESNVSSLSVSFLCACSNCWRNDEK